MAKKATTGVPTRRITTDEKDERSYLSRAEREARAQRWVLLGIGAALAVVILVLLAGLVFEGVIYPNQAVAVVNGESVRTADFQAQVRLTRWQVGRQLANVAALYGATALTSQDSPFYQQYVMLQPGQEYMVGDQVVNQMIDDILLRNEAEARGLSVDEAAVEARVQEYFGYDPNAGTVTPTVEPSPSRTPIVSPTPSPAPTVTPTPELSPTPEYTPFPTVTPQPTLTSEELAQRYNDYVASYISEGAAISGLSQEQVRAVFERQALRELMRDEITKDIPPEEEQVNVRHILVTTEEEAQDVMTALAEGESFAELARSVSIDTGSASSGGELGWAGRGKFVAEFEDAVFNAEVGAIVGPVQSQYGYHIIQVHAREVRPLSADELDSKRDDAFNEWLSGLRDAEGAQVEIYDYADRTPSDPTVFELGLASAS